MTEAIFVKGNQDMMDYTPSTKKDAGDVVILGTEPNKLCGVALRELPANKLGALCKEGTFDVEKTTGFSTTIGNDAHFNESTRKLVSSGGTVIGTYVEAAGGSETRAQVAINQPRGTSEDQAGSSSS